MGKCSEMTPQSLSSNQGPGSRNKCLFQYIYVCMAILLTWNIVSIEWDGQLVNDRIHESWHKIIFRNVYHLYSKRVKIHLAGYIIVISLLLLECSIHRGDALVVLWVVVWSGSGLAGTGETYVFLSHLWSPQVPPSWSPCIFPKPRPQGWSCENISLSGSHL